MKLFSHFKSFINLQNLLKYQPTSLHAVNISVRQCSRASDNDGAKGSQRKAKTPVGKLDAADNGAVRHPYQEKEPLEPFPDNTNPSTGEVGGPKGPEPTRYGDWERKGRVSDF